MLASDHIGDQDACSMVKSTYQNRNPSERVRLGGHGRTARFRRLWREIEPLLPPEPPKPRGGRPRVPDRACLEGIVFVLCTGIGWEQLPQEMGCGSGMTCWRRLRDWQQAGVWVKLHRVLLDRLGRANAVDWSRAALDSASFSAKRSYGAAGVRAG
jgi:transposase